MAPHLVLQFLGLPQIQLDDQPVVTDRRKAIGLLAYLAVNDIGQLHQKYSRESLSALFWPDYEQSKAFTNLPRSCASAPIKRAGALPASATDIAIDSL